jgi:intergrase/recombinase
LDWSATKQRFLEYVEFRKYNKFTARGMVQFLDRFVGRIESPSDVMGVFAKLSVGQQHHLSRAMRAWFKCLELNGLASVEQLEPLRKVIPKDPVMIDINVPEEQEIAAGLRRVPEVALKYRALWSLLLDSGVRLVEAIGVINDFRAENLKEVNGFYRYTIGQFRGCKQAYFAFFTDATLRLINSMNGVSIEASGRNASHYYIKYGCTKPKYLRKFAFDKMIELEVPESVADFIEGRVPKMIGAKHYMALARQAANFYPRYAKYVAELRRKALN